MGFNFKQAWIDCGYYDYWTLEMPEDNGAENMGAYVLNTIADGISFEAGNSGCIDDVIKDAKLLEAALNAGPKWLPPNRTLSYYLSHDWGANFYADEARLPLPTMTPLSWYSIIHEASCIETLTEAWYNYGPGTDYQGFPSSGANVNLWAAVADVVEKTQNIDEYWT